MGLLEANGTPRPAYTAMAQMIQYLGSHPVYLGWVLLNRKDYGFVFRGARDTVLVIWAPKGNPDHIKFNHSVQIVDPITGHISSAAAYDLTSAPILVIGIPAKLTAEAQTNKLRPFPWDGDYTYAKSVSVTLGKTAIEKGLHAGRAKNRNVQHCHMMEASIRQMKLHRHASLTFGRVARLRRLPEVPALGALVGVDVVGIGLVGLLFRLVLFHFIDRFRFVGRQ